MTSIAPVARCGFSLPSGRGPTVPVTWSTYSLRSPWATCLVADDDLGDARGVPQVDERHAPVIAPPVHPPGEGDGLAGCARLAASRRRGCGARIGPSLGVLRPIGRPRDPSWPRTPPAPAAGGLVVLPTAVRGQQRASPAGPASRTRRRSARSAAARRRTPPTPRRPPAARRTLSEPGDRGTGGLLHHLRRSGWPGAWVMPSTCATPGCGVVRQADEQDGAEHRGAQGRADLPGGRLGPRGLTALARPARRPGSRWSAGRTRSRPRCRRSAAPAPGARRRSPSPTRQPEPGDPDHLQRHAQPRDEPRAVPLGQDVGGRSRTGTTRAPASRAPRRRSAPCTRARPGGTAAARRGSRTPPATGSAPRPTRARTSRIRKSRDVDQDRRDRPVPDAVRRPRARRGRPRRAASATGIGDSAPAVQRHARGATRRPAACHQP